MMNFVAGYEADTDQNNERVQASINNYTKEIESLSKKEVKYHNEVFSDIRHEEAFLRQYNEKLIKAYQDLNGIRSNSKMNPNFSQTADQLLQTPPPNSSQFVISPAVLDPLVRAYERKHEILEEEIVSLQGDIKRISSMVELLIKDNSALRKHVEKRNEETSRVLETIGLNDGEVVIRLRQQVEILEEEIKIVQQALEQTKELKEENGIRVEDLERENKDLRQVIKKLRFDHEESKIIVKEMSEKNLMTGERHSDLSKRLEAEMEEKTRLKIQVEKLAAEKERFEKDFRKADSDLKESIRKQQDTDEKLNTELSHLQNEVANLKRNLAYREKENSKLNSLLQFKKDDEGLVSRTVQNEKQKNNELYEENTRLQMRLKEVIQAENNYQEAIVSLKTKLEDANNQLAQKDKQLTTAINKPIGYDMNNQYEKMKVYYEGKISNLEEELENYKSMFNRMYQESQA